MAAREKLMASCRIALVALSLTTGGECHAQDTIPWFGIEWRCMQQHDERYEVACIPRPVRPADLDEAAFAARFRDAILRDRGDNGTRGGAVPVFTGRDMRPVTARGMAAVFSGEAWLVPLFVRPANPAAVTRLLEAVLCDPTVRCTVTYRGILAASSVE